MYKAFDVSSWFCGFLQELLPEIKKLPLLKLEVNCSVEDSLKLFVRSAAWTGAPFEWVFPGEKEKSVPQQKIFCCGLLMSRASSTATRPTEPRGSILGMSNCWASSEKASKKGSEVYFEYNDPQFLEGRQPHS